MAFTERNHGKFYCIHHLFACTSHCENTEKRFPIVCTEDSIFKYICYALTPTTMNVYCGALPLNVFIANIIDANLLRKHIFLTLDFIKSPRTQDIMLFNLKRNE